jgi:plasmid stabilization system protein ParE
MSSSLKLTFAARAEDDLRRLLATSRVMWGEEQRDAYAERLAAAMQ